MEEVEALKAMYPEEGAVVMDEHGAASRYHYLGDAQGRQSPVSGSIFFPGILIEGRRCGMHFQLPVNYPAQVPSIQVICEGDREIHDRLTDVVSACMEEHCGGNGILLLTLNALQEAVEAIPPQVEQEDGGLSEAVVWESLSRLVLWFHHIKNLNKRKSILGWATELRIRGFCKPGCPGIVICEGLEDDVKEYCRRIKAMRWQAISVRAEETDQPVSGPLNSRAWHFQAAFQELGEGDMDVLAVKCADASLTHLFKAALKLA